MSTGSLYDIFEELKNIDGAYQPGDPIGDQTTSRSKTFLIDAPEWFDSGSVPRGIPIYFPEEQEAFPFQGEGEAIERLAWYRSYHYGLDKWGIYLLRSGVYKVANALLSAGIEPSLALSRARDFLIRHERTHFQTDFGVTSLELATRQSIFIPTRKQLNSTAPGWHKMEEGLANSYGYRSLKKDNKFIDTFLSTSPTGYRDWRRYKGVKDLETWLPQTLRFTPEWDSSYLKADPSTGYGSEYLSTEPFRTVPFQVFVITTFHDDVNGDFVWTGYRHFVYKDGQIYNFVTPCVSFDEQANSKFSVEIPVAPIPFKAPAGKVDKTSNAYKTMFNVGANFAKVSLASDTAMSQCSSASKSGMIHNNGIPQYLGVQTKMIQSYLQTASGFQGCLDGFGH